MRSRLGLSDDDVVVLWNGGLWNWFDPITVVHAALLAAKEEPRLRLVFLAGPRPRAGRGEDAMNRQVRALAGELDPQAHVVKFVENWVPYRERADYLLDADAAVCAHQDHLETRLAFRTRILDALWAGLPVITTDGDVWAELIERAGAGLVVPCEDVGGMADALVTLGASPEHRRAMGVAAAALADGYRWSRIAADVAPTLDPAAPRLASVSSLRLRLSGLRLRATQAREAIGLLAQGGPRRSRR
jgi:glycosyltransferase involved in cell wall biosynthesis